MPATPSDLAVIADFIKSVGFPVFVACVLLFQVYAMHRDNLIAINHLTTELSLLRKVLENVHTGGKSNG